MISLGRDPAECDLVFPDTRVSRKHVTIEYTVKGQVYLIDYNSKNGTFYNGIQIINRMQIETPRKNQGELKFGPHTAYLKVEDVKSIDKKISGESTEIEIN